MEPCPFCSEKYPVVYSDRQTIVMKTAPGHYAVATKAHLPATPPNLSCVGFFLNIPHIMGMKKARLVMDIDLETPDEHIHCEIIEVK